MQVLLAFVLLRSLIVESTWTLVVPEITLDVLLRMGASDTRDSPSLRGD
jgi:hypothetical protein